MRPSSRFSPACDAKARAPRVRPSGSRRRGAAEGAGSGERHEPGTTGAQSAREERDRRSSDDDKEKKAPEVLSLLFSFSLPLSEAIRLALPPEQKSRALTRRYAPRLKSRARNTPESASRERCRNEVKKKQEAQDRPPPPPLDALSLLSLSFERANERSQNRRGVLFFAFTERFGWLAG